MEKRYAVIEAPSILGLKPSGVEGLARSLLEHGLADAIAARRAGRVEPPPYSSDRDRETLTLNAAAIAAWSPLLADAVERVLDRGEFPVVLGGDCSILLGSSLAFKRRGRFGLFFIDGHADFYQPEANPNGEAASMELAFTTGYGPSLLADLEGRGPLVRPQDVVAFGFRDADEQKHYRSQPLPPDMLGLDLHAVRRLGIAAAVAKGLSSVTRRDLDGFFVHLDADSLDDRIMPAVDYRIPDGFSWDEMTSILAALLATGRAVGLEITIYNPALDTTGEAGRQLTRMLAAVLGTAAPVRV